MSPESAGLDAAFDVVVVGAGINGSGIARDAAIRGLSVLLLDKTDIAAGTTSWSSRLIHGGLRYLEHGEVSLVYESLQERERLLHIAPHLVFPLPLTLPIYEYHKRGPLMIRAGMVAYDTLSWKKSLPRHQMFSRQAALAHERGLNPRGLKGAARYYDAQVEFPERISVENTLDAVRHGAVVRTGARATGITLEAGVVRGVEIELADGTRQSVRAGVVVNVAGPWVDEVLAQAGIKSPSQRLLGVTKGTHIVVRPFPGAPSDAMYVEARSDGRPYFIIPWNGLYLIGTTDVRYDGDPDNVVPTEEEIAYLLDETNQVIPAAVLDRDSVCYAYAGLRPLPYQEEGSESGITRRHIIKDHAPHVRGLLSVVGGKLTTFRNLAEQVVDEIGERLGRSLPASTTATLPLPGAVDAIAAYTREFIANRPDWLAEQSAAQMVRIYGGRASEVLALAEARPELREVVSDETGAIAATVALAFETEHARTLTDVVMRRTMIGYAADCGFARLTDLAQVARDVAGWSEAEMLEQVEQHTQYMERFLPAGIRSAAAPMST